MGLIYVADSQAYPQGGKTTTTIPDHGLSRDRKKAHSNGGRHIDWTRGPVTTAAHPITARSASVGLSRERGGKEGKQISNITQKNVGERTAQSCRPGKSSQQQRGRRPHTERQARVPDHGNSMQSAERSYTADWVSD